MTVSAEQVVRVENAHGKGNLVLVCEHATNVIPKQFDCLGLAQDALNSHSAWDPGALQLAQLLSHHFDAPLVASEVSRLVYDCNRSPDSPTAIVLHTEIQPVPGNQNLTEAAKQERVELAYLPFKQALQSVIEGKSKTNIRPALITVHSFTPVYQARRREVEIGILHDEDSRLADGMLNAVHPDSAIKIRRNEPYSACDGVTHTLQEHALPGHLLNVMIEVRNDLLYDAASTAQIALMLSDLIEQGLKVCQHHPSQPSGAGMDD